MLLNAKPEEFSWQQRLNISKSVGTYKLRAAAFSNGASNYTLSANFTPKKIYTYADVMNLPKINGDDAWRTIPYKLSNENRNPVWSCNGELNRHICVDCAEEISYDLCTEPHHKNAHYVGDPICYKACSDDSKHDVNYTQDRNINSPSAEFVSIDWDFTLYASTYDNFRNTQAFSIKAIQNETGRGYYNDEDLIRFTRAKYIKFPWYTLYYKNFLNVNKILPVFFFVKIFSCLGIIILFDKNILSKFILL